MKTEFKLFVAPIAIPLVHIMPFQWKRVGSKDPVTPVDAFPTAHPSLVFIGLFSGGPKLIEVKLFKVGLVTAPQLVPSK
jgi:hypothetical protein